ncbi:tetratricopeptide repeat protein [Altererythrobacter aurantiacus]|uniref:Tetratricopeptide repeat protein n=1 Tax=Parapontixanthobacter aurantiacus TaxID=1463599 RepID=A0A844ZCR7_9SPHN|nr:SPOR domain-containing protein [Parapontixanthobacter aurantiacus]MXO84710.1 tetratricopeptide repeat protein [Parapontixanthobacter aurantiacus]
MKRFIDPCTMAALGGVAVALASIAATPAYAQGREIVQPLPPPEVDELGDALQRLARDASNVSALIDAGEASLALGDVQAAIGFFGRASDIAPNNPRILSGLADAYVATRRPIEALRLYTEAERAGADVARIAGQRGLAFDLVGDNAAAQDQYRLALRQNDDPEITLRLATSQAIAGQRQQFEASLRPLLERGDLAAFRTRSFGLAILGDTTEAISIARAITPPALIDGLVPYLRAMDQLTAVQQASAANLGVFPRRSEFGRDDPSIAEARAALPPAAAQSRARPNATDARLRPAGRPLGPGANQPPARVVEPEGELRRQGTGELPPLNPAQAAAQPDPVQRPVVQQTQAAAPTRPVVRPDIATVFADMATPSGARPSAGAVDLATIVPAKPEPAKAQPAAPPPPDPATLHPARIWVQVATGQDKKALRFDWRRLSRNADGALADYKPFTSRWGQTNRMLVGPFSTRQEASALIVTLREAGIDTFRHDSSSGVPVEPLP